MHDLITEFIAEGLVDIAEPLDPKLHHNVFFAGVLRQRVFHLAYKPLHVGDAGQRVRKTQPFHLLAVALGKVLANGLILFPGGLLVEQKIVLLAAAGDRVVHVQDAPVPVPVYQQQGEPQAECIEHFPAGVQRGG